MAKAQVQETFDVFKQKKIPAIETRADKFNDLRDTISGLKVELDAAELLLNKEMHANADKLDHQQDAKGRKLLVYNRADYKVAVREQKEIVNVKIGKASKGTAPDGDGAEE